MHTDARVSLLSNSVSVYVSTGCGKIVLGMASHILEAGHPSSSFMPAYVVFIFSFLIEMKKPSKGLERD